MSEYEWPELTPEEIRQMQGADGDRADGDKS